MKHPKLSGGCLLLHVKKEDDQSTGLNNNQGITKRLFKQSRQLEKKSEVRDLAKEAAAVKPSLTLLEVTTQCPNPWPCRKEQPGDSVRSCTFVSGGSPAGCNTQGDSAGATI